MNPVEQYGMIVAAQLRDTADMLAVPLFPQGRVSRMSAAWRGRPGRRSRARKGEPRNERSE